MALIWRKFYYLNYTYKIVNSVFFQVKPVLWLIKIYAEQFAKSFQYSFHETGTFV